MSPEGYRRLIERHVEAVLDRLRADPELAESVFEGEVRGDPERYVNVFHDTGFYSAHDFTEAPTDVEVTFTIHSVGRDRWQAVWVSGRVVAQLMGFVPQVAGRRCWRVSPAGTQPVALDRDTSPPKYLAVDRFTLRSTPGLI